MKKLLKGILTSAVLLSVTACGGPSVPELKEESLTLEYGQDPYDLQLVDLLENYDEIKDKYPFSIALFDAKDQEIKEESITEDQLLQVGEYTLKINYAEDTEPLQLPVTIKDTVAPEFKDFKEKASVDYGYDKDLAKLFSAEDLAEVTIRIDGKVDTDKAGDYKVKVIAEDANGNKTEKECTITVKEKPKASGSSSSNNTAAPSGSSHSGNTSAGKPSANSSGSSSGSGNTSSGSSSGSGSSSTGTSGNNQQSCTIHPNSLMGNTNTKFPHNDAGYSEAWEWANKVWNDTNSEWYKYSAFEVGSIFDTCGNHWYTVNFY